MAGCTVRTRKVMTNPLLGRRQMVVDVYHPERGTISKSEIRKTLAQKLKVADKKTIFVFGFRTAFGGQKSTGFATVYNTLEEAFAVEPKYRFVRAKIIPGDAHPSTRHIRKHDKVLRSRLPGLQKVNGKRKRNRDEED